MEQPMDNQQSGGEMMQPRSRRTMWLVAGTIVVLALLLLWFWYTPATAPEADISGPALSEQDTTSVIEAELEATDLGDIEAEFESIEAELENL